MSLDCSEELHEKYIQEFRKLRCCNIPLSKFVKQCEEARRDRELYQQYFKTLFPINKSLELPNISKSPPGETVRRCVVIDGPNIMHGGSVVADKRINAPHKNIPDVLALISLLRYFFINGFDAFAVISSKYKISDTTNYKTAIDELIKHKLCVVAIDNNIDDLLALEFAAMLNGVVISSDWFRDHQREMDRYEEMVEHNYIGLEFTFKLPEMCRTSDGVNFIPNKMFKFKHLENPRLSEDDLIKHLHVTPDNARYELSLEKRKLSWSEKRREEVISILNRLIVDGFTVCPANIERILSTPVYIPKHRREDDDDEIDW